jgi:uncharacterized membrane protein
MQPRCKKREAFGIQNSGDSSCVVGPGDEFPGSSSSPLAPNVSILLIYTLCRHVVDAVPLRAFVFAFAFAFAFAFVFLVLRTLLLPTVNKTSDEFYTRLLTRLYAYFITRYALSTRICSLISDRRRKCRLAPKAYI